jgi:hypothetical protein
MKITKTQLRKIIKEELESEMHEGHYDGPYGDDVDSPSLQDKMGAAILAAVEALEAGNLEAARAAFSADLLKNLSPYSGPEGEGSSAADMERYESDYRDPPRKPFKPGKGRNPPTAAQLDAMDKYDI